MYQKELATTIRIIVICIVLSVAVGSSSGDEGVVAINQFTLNLLEDICNQEQPNKNLILSPYTIWTVLSVFNEGARGNTSKELDKVLGNSQLLEERQKIREQAKLIFQTITQNYGGSSLEIFNAIFTQLALKIKSNFRQLVQKVYNVKIQNIDFSNADTAAKAISKQISAVTKERITDAVTADIIDPNIQMLATSVLYFKGFWNTSFDKNSTREERFHDEQGNDIGKVKMMVNYGLFYSGKLFDGKALGIEIPYADNKTSMIIFRPGFNITLSSVLREMRLNKIPSIMETIERYPSLDGEKLYIPKFKLFTDLKLRDALRRLGVTYAFEESKADFSGIADTPSFISHFIHKAEVEITEEGTEGSAASVATAGYRSGGLDTKVNKPFLFLVVDKQTKVIIFAGRVTNPNEK